MKYICIRSFTPTYHSDIYNLKKGDSFFYSSDGKCKHFLVHRASGRVSAIYLLPYEIDDNFIAEREQKINFLLDLS